jgi:hypothetical protein
VSSTGPRPLYTADQAVVRALERVGRGVYQLGTGDLNSSGDDPRDCFGFACCEVYGIRRHRPGFNAGSWASVSDDLNCNSAIEDADHAGEMFARATVPTPGVLIAYPTIYLPGHSQPFIGHVGIVVGVSRMGSWEADRPRYDLLDVVQCHGPNGQRPGIVRTDGSIWAHHDTLWPKAEHRTAMLRVR